MICSAYGQHHDLAALRRRFPISLKGVTLAQLISCSADLGFSSRPLRLDLNELDKLRLPCILHWDLDHFIVLKKVLNRKRGIVIVDPAVGQRRLSMMEISRHFTGVALELTPNSDFKPERRAPRVRLSELTGRVGGLKRSLVQIFLVALTLQLFAIAAPLLTQIVIDDVLASADRDLLNLLILGFGLLLAVQTALGLARSWMVTVLSQNLALQWTGNVFAHLVRLPVSYFERRHLGDITSRFGAVGAIQRTLTTAVIEAVLDGLMGVSALLMMLLYAPKLAGVVVASVMTYGLLRWAAYAPLRNASAERIMIAAKENTHFIETLRGILPLKLFGREEERRIRWQNLVVEVQNRDVRTAKMTIAFSTAKELLFGFENLLVLWLGAQAIMDSQMGLAGTGTMTVGMLMAFLSYKGQFSKRVSALIDYAVELRMLSLQSERLADIALEPPERDEQPHNELLHLAPTLELRNVSYRYAAGEPWVLRNASLKVGAGECVALVGQSGAGKTTLLKILLGILRPIEGDVLYGGIPLRQLGLANVRRQIGTVMQEDVLMSGSLADNICFFDVRPDHARIEACARLSKLHHEIGRMPMGYQTLVGDLGSGLSGGQKQRLLLARALYKQPKVLALDEATSHLDLGNEQAVTAELECMQLTRLIVAHRPEAIAGVRRVVQLSNGQVVDISRSAESAEAAHSLL